MFPAHVKTPNSKLVIERLPSPEIETQIRYYFCKQFNLFRNHFLSLTIVNTEEGTVATTEPAATEAPNGVTTAVPDGASAAPEGNSTASGSGKNTTDPGTTTSEPSTTSAKIIEAVDPVTTTTVRTVAKGNAMSECEISFSPFLLNYFDLLRKHPSPISDLFFNFLPTEQ